MKKGEANQSLINRDLSLLTFQHRVLAQAADKRLPLMERLRYLCIVSNNLDEFFEIRVSGIKEKIRHQDLLVDTEGIEPECLFWTVSQWVHEIVHEQYRLLNGEILPALKEEGIRFIPRSHWTEEQSAWIQSYFINEVMPVLTPIGLDPAHPFPRVLNKSLNFAVDLQGGDAFGRAVDMGIVQAPRSLPRVIRLPRHLSGGDGYAFVFLSSVMHANVATLFPGVEVLGCYQFRVTRNSDLFLDEEEVKDLRSAIKGELQQRSYGEAVRLEVADNCSEKIAKFLLQHFHLEERDLYRSQGIVNLVRLMQVFDWVARPDLKYEPFQPGLPRPMQQGESVMKVMAKTDILLHHPYQSFSPVIDLLSAAADDPDVVAVKMTVYRTGTDSVLMGHLIRAALNGKEVTVVFELMARFDEEANLSWATRLEKAGAHVVYGVFGYKVHAKLLMLVCRENKGLKYYVHMGTGNYHPGTARSYTDFGLMTCHPEICKDVADIFKQLTGFGSAPVLRQLWQAPFNLHDRLIQAIEQEAQIARAGGRGQIIAKMNALLERKVIQALYDASQAGVKIDLIVRGACALRPGVEGLSKNIRVRSIVGRFLEHHRVFYFRADGQELVYLSSADWMSRNFFRRVEIAFPILDAKLKRRVLREGLRAYLADNMQTWELLPEGRYRLKKPRKYEISAQELLIERLQLKEV